MKWTWMLAVQLFVIAISLLISVESAKSAREAWATADRFEAVANKAIADAKHSNDVAEAALAYCGTPR